MRDWQRGQFEVITPVSVIDVMVPPRDAVVSQWYEMWNRGGAIRRCDSQREQISDGPCLCPHAEDPEDREEVERTALRRSEMAKANPPQACKLVTRINVMIPDLPGLGVFRLDTGSFYAAAETGDKADLMEMARAQGVFLAAQLRIEKRQRVAGGKTTEYPVPVLEIMPTFRQIATGELAQAGVVAQLPPAPASTRLAITAPAVPRAPLPVPERELTAQEIYEQAHEALSRATVQALIAQAEAARVDQDLVRISDDPEEWAELRSSLRDIWRDLPKPVVPDE